MKCRDRLTKILDHVYMDLESDPDGKIENDNGKMVYIKPADARGLYDYDMVWNDLIHMGGTEQIELENGTVCIWLT